MFRSSWQLCTASTTTVTGTTALPEAVDRTGLTATAKSRIAKALPLLKVRAPASPFAVRAVTTALAPDRFPAASRARTTNEYSVSAANPPTLTEVPAELATTSSPRYTSYPVTPTLSVAASHPNATEAAVTPVARGFPGTEGASVSPPGSPVTNVSPHFFNASPTG